MTDHAIITSAALYFEPKGQSIPMSWFENACQLFWDFELSPILFTAAGGDFQLDDCHVLAERGGDIFRFGELLRARAEDLVEAIARAEVDALCLDSTRAEADDRQSWRAAVSLFSRVGESYVGVDKDLTPDHSALLRRAYKMGNEFLDIRYGITYDLPLSEHPDCYATGFKPLKLKDFRAFVRRENKRAGHNRSPDEFWNEEIRGRARHLTGLFRGAYPANILSEAHVENADLRSHGIGRLSELNANASLWLWELSDAEIPAAQAHLESRHVLVQDN